MNRKKIAGAALNQTPIDWQNNITNIKEAIELARSQGVSILLLPELCITGYGCEDMFLSEWIYEKALDILEELVPLTTGIAVSIGIPMKYNQVNYNTSCMVHDGKILGFTAKQFLANDGVHYEHRWFKPWPKNLKIQLETKLGNYDFGDVQYEIEGVKVGFEICEDAWHEQDRPGIRLAAKGIHLILNPSASHFSFHKTRLREKDVVVNASRKFNCVYLYANLLGNEAGRIVYDGEIMIASQGKLLYKNRRLSFKQVNLGVSELDFDSLEGLGLPINTDIDDKNNEFPAALALCLYDYMRKSRSKGFVLSLSGGADSSCCAIMVAEMVRRGLMELGPSAFIIKGNLQSLFDGEDLDRLGFEEIMPKVLVTVYQWAANSGWDTFDSAQGLAKSLNAKFYSWRIDKEVASYTDTIEVSLQRKLRWDTDDIALQNIQARSRAPIVWMLANINHALLITTSNRSEGDVGYTTMDGDTCGSIAPIAGVDKIFVQEWLKWAQQQLGYEGLSYVNALVPTAELRPADKAQTDEKDLMPYAILAQIERAAIRYWHSPVQVFEKLRHENLCNEDALKSYIIKFYKMWSRNQWKRERIAPSFLLDDFNVDPRTWCRFPILSGGFEAELRALES
ncbi:MAG TPA: nitrilase-related carbon-nitrogen hydrolase [Cytophagales bacterium]|nr:nitrilase-related carbon-nitrogen hydrolase [Cytophagales bacterium]